jgi:hypothetical protein
LVIKILVSIWILAACSPACLQSSDDTTPPGIVRGELLATEGTAISGTLSIRDDESRVTRCSYDARTYIEIQKELATPGQLRTGDRLEVLTDRQPGAAGCYIRSIHVQSAPAPAAAGAGPLSPNRAFALRRGPPPGGSVYVIDNIYPRGNLTYSGVVIRLNPERLVLHTRSADETIFLRGDTRYLASGLAVEAAQLRVNCRVFVRAGRNLDNELEAFQVVWGEILQPR